MGLRKDGINHGPPPVPVKAPDQWAAAYGPRRAGRCVDASCGRAGVEHVHPGNRPDVIARIDPDTGEWLDRAVSS